MPVIGTAGHVDHGKSSLIEALTGTHPDRLPEEVERGMTIDLGFAHFTGPAGEPVGVIDVPGHERFIRNMAAGAWGLDLALLAVAADDGWMRQSEDHTRVLRSMGVERLIVAVTKSDLADPARLELVRQQALECCARLGYPGAPSLAVSARTGENIESLRRLILRSLEGVSPSLPYGPGPGLPLLWVDRVFSVRGSGVVVTGTLRCGPVERGQELILLPQRRAVRIRGLQSYYRELDRAEPGSRVALNLHGIDTGEASRGDCLTVPQAACWIEREFVIRHGKDAGKPDTPSAPPAPALKNHSELEVALGTGHRLARLDRLDERGLFRARCEEAAALFWNQPCLLIRHGGSEILGGARVVWGGPLDRRLRAPLGLALEPLPYPMRPEDLGPVRLAVLGRVRRGEIGEPSPPAVARDDWLFHPEALDRLEKEILRLAGQPGGVQRSELSGKLGVEAEALAPVLEALRVQGRLVARGGLLFPPADPHRTLSPLARRLLEDLLRAGTEGLEPQKLKVAGAQKELATLARTGLAVSLDGAIYYAAETYALLARAILAGRAAGELLELAQAKKASGLSRKYLIPLLNRMELDGYVKREGDARRVRRLPEGTDASGPG
jgi:selenocysteine-specific elongation factor